jgi:hypothetical protein
MTYATCVCTVTVRSAAGWDARNLGEINQCLNRHYEENDFSSGALVCSFVYKGY